MSYYRDVVLEKEDIPEVEPVVEEFLTDNLDDLAMAEADSEFEADEEI